ncbi:alpha/beta fold hydrolase [Hyalangium versicolor]|uniref:alpha/beta fold hydrolase n=1 Tax=Hyalangium versicolor TaxID=2861190 RepID=UPI001CCC4214|nr:alpha/beta hydrolase [Hyalangium versicolor]
MHALKSRDGIRLFHVSEGQGSPPLVFLHGGLGQHAHFAPQVKHFQQTHRILAPDLRGHGRSDAPRQLYSIEGFAEDVAFLCSEESLEQAVVVGHSMGGLVALELAVRFPKLACAIVLLESPVVPPADHAKRSDALLSMLRGPDFTRTVEQWARHMVGPSSPHAEQVVTDMVATPQFVAVSAIEHMLRYDSAAAAASCQVPMLVVDGAVDTERLRRLCPRAVFGKTVGGGHYIQLDVPVQVNDMIERFIRGLGEAKEK